ncbi:hypothetical protein WJX81_003109 [Elliptochloris bilobata]|uniref:Uncharacterized protein n=1 Tax=Elliptochloris bilobata TaxID=381761 RepID=A0AAW1S3U6_9CHLO
MAASEPIVPWLSLVTQVLEPSGTESLALNKVRARAVKRAAKLLGECACKPRLKAAFNSFISDAKSKGQLAFIGEHVQLAQAQAKRSNKRKAPGEPAVSSPARHSDDFVTGRLCARQCGGNAWDASMKRTDVKHGRFSAAEKATLRAAVEAYAREHELSTTDLRWLFETMSGEDRRRSKGAWNAVAAALPHRRIKAVWSCGTRMFHDANYQGRWSEEDTTRLLALVAERGQRWQSIGTALGRMPEACRDRYRETRLGAARRSGRWTPEEEALLADIVPDALAGAQAARAAAPREGSSRGTEQDGRVVLDDINWAAVSERLGTRSPLQCMGKWYSKLSPSMVARGDWGSGDDRRLLRALLASGAAQEWQPDWGALVPTRTAAQARRRWRLMLKCVPEPAERGFRGALDFLMRRLEMVP